MTENHFITAELNYLWLELMWLWTLGYVSSNRMKYQDIIESRPSGTLTHCVLCKSDEWRAGLYQTRLTKIPLIQDDFLKRESFLTTWPLHFKPVVGERSGRHSGTVSVSALRGHTHATHHYPHYFTRKKGEKGGKKGHGSAPYWLILSHKIRVHIRRKDWLHSFSLCTEEQCLF